MAPYTMSYDLIEVARSLCPRTNLHFLGQNLYFIGLAASQILDQNLTKKIVSWIFLIKENLLLKRLIHLMGK